MNYRWVTAKKGLIVYNESFLLKVIINAINDFRTELISFSSSHFGKRFMS